MSQPIDISPRAKKTIKELLQRYLPGVTVWAYGSRVKWTARPDSDLDLVVFAGQEQWNDVANLREAFDESNLLFRIDVFTWDEVPETFRGEIREDYVVIQEDGRRREVKAEHRPFMDLLSAIIDNRGKTCPTAERGIPLIKTNCIRNNLLYPALEDLRYVSRATYDTWFRGHPEPGDMVFVTKGTPGRICWVPDPVGFCIAQDMVAIRANHEQVYPKFLFALLRSPGVQADIENMHVGTLIPHFKKGDFGKLNLRIPKDYEVQKSIGDFYFLLSLQIELNRHMNQTLEAMAQAIFKSWFVDFDPVKAKQTAKMLGENPERAAMAALSGKLCIPKNLGDIAVDDLAKAEADLDQLGEGEQQQLVQTAALFPDGFVESELGLIPEGWTSSKVRDVIEGLYDGPHATPPKSDEGAVFLGIKNLTGTQIDLSDIRHISEKDWAKWTKRVVPGSGDIVLTYEATLGYFAIIPPDLRCCLGRRLALVRPSLDLDNRHFLFHTFVATPFQQYLHAHVIHGATVNRVPLTEFPNYPLLWPSTALVQRFENLARSIWERIHLNQSEIRRLASIRDALLPKLLSGELPIKILESTADKHFMGIPEVV